MIANLMVGAIRLYQRFLSPLLPPACRYTPSCSHYTVEAIQLWGPLRGGWMGAKRICRCQPFHPGGHDPVPRPPALPGDGALRLRPSRRAASGAGEA